MCFGIFAHSFSIFAGDEIPISGIRICQVGKFETLPPKIRVTCSISNLLIAQDASTLEY